MNRDRISAKSTLVETRLKRALDEGEGLVVVRAPPGSGKTFLLLRGVAHARGNRLRVAVGAQTNSQADDICRRLDAEYPDLDVVRFAAGGRSPVDLGDNVSWTSNKRRLPLGPCIVVATVAKWTLTELRRSYDVLFVDEAWQMAWADFMLCGKVAPRFVLIGDPGQIPPVVPIPAQRWETSSRAPHHPAPEVILADPQIPRLAFDLPACRRLPHDSVELVRPFYDFEFASWAEPGERYVRIPAAEGWHSRLDPALNLFASGSVVALTTPTPAEGPPLELDEEIAVLTAETAARVLERGARTVANDDGAERELGPGEIGVAATHRVMNNAIQQALSPELRNDVVVDTPERWQGLERKLMIAVHPLSGVTAPSSFDLETGRLCVMISRHRSGLIVVSRDHIQTTLENHIPVADQPLGRPDVTGRGHQAHLAFWERIVELGRIVGV